MPGSNKRKFEKGKCQNQCLDTEYDPEVCAIFDCPEKANHRIKFPGFFDREYYETMICHDHYDHYDKNPDFFEAIDFKRKYKR